VKKSLVGAITASLLIAAFVVMFSATRTPTYEASAKVLVEDQKEQSYGKIHPIPNAPTHERLRQLIQTMVIVIETRPVAEGVIRRLDLRMSPDKLLDNLFVEQDGTSQLIHLTYTDTDPERATRVVNTVGQVSSERISEWNATSNNITATVFEKASVTDAPASPKPLRNGLIALVAALALLAAMIEARRRGRINEGCER
jgi:capsular polysaccharide biosynthesis protein